MAHTLCRAVLYDPEGVLIGNVIRDFFEENGCPIDVVFYTNYELQVDALIKRHIDIAWNSPLAWLDAQRRSSDRCRAIAMRDTDRDRVSYIVVKASSGITTVSDLRGKIIAVGAKDSPQATLIPIGFLQQHGLEPSRDIQVKRFDVLVGKHGDHVGGELQAFQCLARGEAAACSMLDLNWHTWTRDGTINADGYFLLATTEKFDHCVFTVNEDLPVDSEQMWLTVLFSMNYDNPKHRETMDLEGVKKWLSGRTTGFGPLRDAVARQRFFDPTST